MSITSPTARVLRGAAAALAVPLLLVACSSKNDAEPAKSADAVEIKNQWAKAADSGMSAAFGELVNSSDRTITVLSATSPAAKSVEMHEIVADAAGNKTMRPKPGGFVIPAHGSTTLRPGADHIMFIGLNAPLRTGSETPVTLTFGDGSTKTFTAQVRDFSGNQEKYAPEGDAQTPAHGG
ncbi:copper chaperone PCu(A)C [Nocardia sp. NPDC052566]|uniref:copper chaperone PCu(A)C n=1 Tax=Nocardia sp. NPDC052566 TaxID=3364330 RepID=UPI0037C79937